MGLFDYVNYKMPCPKCGKEISNFQSKDKADCYLRRIDFWEVDHFYSDCAYCGLWIEFARKRPLKPKIEDYEMRTEEYDKETKESQVAYYEPKQKYLIESEYLKNIPADVLCDPAKLKALAYACKDTFPPSIISINTTEEL